MGKLSGTREIADHEGLPQSFLGKVLLALRRDRFLRSQKGIRGGYELAMVPEQISLLAIVRSIDGEPLTECPLEDHQCSVPRSSREVVPRWGRESGSPARRSARWSGVVARRAGVTSEYSGA